MSPRERNTTCRQQTPTAYNHGGVPPVADVYQRRSSSSSGVSFNQSDDSTRPFVTSPGHTPLVSCMSPVRPDTADLPANFFAPRALHPSLDWQLPDVVLKGTPDKRDRLPDNTKRKAKKKRRIKPQSRVGVTPIEDTDCLDTSSTSGAVIFPSSQMDASDSYAWLWRVAKCKGTQLYR